MPPEKESSETTYYEVLKNDNFTLYTIAKISTVFGTGLSGMAFILLAFGDIGSILNVGFYRIAAIVPTVTLGLFIGVYVDRWGKKRSYIVTSLLSAFIVLIPIFYRDIVSIVAVVLVLTALGIFRESAHQSILPLILKKDKLRTGNSVMRVARTGAGMIAPTLAIFLINWYGFWLLFVIDSVTYLLDLICLYYIPIDERKSDQEEKGAIGVINDITASIKHLRERPTVALMMGFSTLMVVLVDGFGLFALESSHVFFGSELPYGYYRSAIFVGAFIGGLLTGKYLQDIGYKYIIFLTFLLKGISFLGLSLFMFIPSFVIFGATFGISSSIMGIGIDTCIQALCDEEYLGRISSLEMVLLRGSGLIAVIVAVGLIRTIGSRPSMLYLGTLIALSAFLVLPLHEKISD